MLIARAKEAFEKSQVDKTRQTEPNDQIHPSLLERAYARCEEITRQNSHTFYLASSLLPAEKRRATRALYAFCRTSDDLVDCSFGEVFEELQAWQQASLGDHKDQENLVVIAWSETRKQYCIPIRYAEQLLEGVTHDLQKRRYGTFEELASYCYGVASTVGLMSMHIIGFKGPEAIPYAVKLGVALQLTNILRDVGEDWRAGRLYLPHQELAGFGLSEKVIERGEVTEAWREFMRFQIQRTRDLYAESLPGIQYLHPDGQFAIAAAALLYQDILKDIEEHEYDVFNRRAHVTTREKLLRFPDIWRQARKR
jgi:phytoene synthase